MTTASLQTAGRKTKMAHPIYADSAVGAAGLMFDHWLDQPALFHAAQPEKFDAPKLDSDDFGAGIDLYHPDGLH